MLWKKQLLTVAKNAILVGASYDEFLDFCRAYFLERAIFIYGTKTIAAEKIKIHRNLYNRKRKTKRVRRNGV